MPASVPQDAPSQLVPGVETFEAAYQQLKEAVERLEDGRLSLQASMDLFERGVQLAQQCERLLTQAELRVQRIAHAGSSAPGSDDPAA